MIIVVGSFPLGVAEEADPWVCFQVKNDVGWELEGVRVTAIQRSINRPGTMSEAFSNATGHVKFTLPRSTYAFLLEDGKLPSDPARNGIIYLPKPLPEVALPGSGGLTIDACGDGVDGFRVGDANGIVVLGGPPTQGYLTLTISDRAAAGSPPLPLARVASPTIQADNDHGFTKTDVDGKVRMACIASVSNNITVHKEGFLPLATSRTCSTGLNAVTYPLWRIPTHVEISVTNETGVARGASGLGVIPGSDGTRSIVATARVTVTGRAATLSDEPAVCPSLTSQPLVAAGVTLERATPAFTGSTVTPYLCSAPTDSTGRATLILPWAEVGMGAYEITTAAPGYAPGITDVPIDATWVRGTDPSWISGGAPTGIYRADVILQRAVVTITDAVRDIRGDPVVGASVTLDQSDLLTPLMPGAEPVTFSGMSDTTGRFSITAPTGPYRITITSDKATRTCTTTLGVDGHGGARFIDTQPAYCLTLLSTGKAGITGIVLDGKVGAPAEGTVVCHGSGANLACDTTRVDGSWRIEAAPNTTLTGASGMRLTAGPWDSFTVGFNGNSPAANAIADTGTKNANRVRILTTIHVQDVAGEPIARADVNLHRDGVVIHQHNADNVTSTSGDYVLRFVGNASLLETVWSAREGASQYDIAPYVATAIKYRGSNGPLFRAKASAAFHVPWGVEHVRESLTLDEVTGTYSVAVLSNDAHTGQSVDALVQAVTDTPHRGAGPSSLVRTPGSLTLYTEFAPYRICSAADERYTEDLSALRCVPIGKPGDPDGLDSATVIANRTRVNLTFRGVDPHSGYLLAGYNASMVSNEGLTCNPQGEFHLSPFFCDLSTARSGVFTATFVIPWTDGERDLCLEGAARPYAAVIPGTPSNTIAVAALAGTGVNANETLDFQASRICRAWPPQSGTLVVDVRPLRAAGPSRLTGSVLDPEGTAAVGATIVASGTGGVLCNPTLHHSVPTSYCEATAGAAGSYSILLPVTSANATWTVSADRPGDYSESYTDWSPSMGVSGHFVLYPKEFDLIVTILDTSPSGASHACGSSAFSVFASLKDFHDGDPDPRNPTSTRSRAIPQPDTTCIAQIHVEDWHRDPSPRHVLAGPWPVTTMPFLVSSDHENHLGEMLANIGPRDPDRRVLVQMFHPTTVVIEGVATLSGRVWDADGDRVLTEAVGLAARVAATPLDPGCLSLGVNAMTDVEGNYELPLPCLGAYRVTVVPLAGSHWTRVTAEIEVVESAALDVPVPRARSNFVVHVQRAGAGPGEGFLVSLDGLDVPDQSVRVSGPGGQVVFEEIPWGVYRVVGPQRSVPLVKLVSPGSESATLTTF